MTINKHAFPKEERLSLKKEIDRLFGHPDLRITTYPLLFLVRIRKETGPVRVIISVPKRKIKKAVDRNKVRRRIREAYRTNKLQLLGVLPEGLTIDLAIVYLGTAVENYSDIHTALITLMNDTGKRFPESH